MSQSEARQDSNPILEKMDQLIKSGHQGEVRNLLLDMNWSQIPRHLAVEFADIARRVNTPKLILIILKPIVYPEIKNQAPATVREQALYASGLSRLGVYTEAEIILEKLDDRDHPQVILFYAFNYMFQWDYAAAAIHLRRYIRLKDLDPYLRTVGRVNLAFCLTQLLNWEQSEQVLNEIWEEVLKPQDGQAQTEKLNLLYANSLEISAQLEIYRCQFAAADIQLGKAEKILSGTGSRYELWFKKWKFILALLKDPKNSQALLDLQHIRNEALTVRDFEVARDCDFFQAFALRDDELFLKVYHGSGFKSYRTRIKRLYKPQMKLTDSYVWRYESASSSTDPVRTFHLKEGRELNGSSELHSSQLSFRLLQALTEDFYRPVAKGTLISKLYPNEHFNPITSPQKTVKVITQLRSWIKQNSLPLEIHCYRGEYQLRALASIHFLISPKDKTPQINNYKLLEKLKTYFIEKNFSSKEAAAALSTSERSARRYLLEARKAGLVLQLRGGRTALYRFKK